MSCGLRISLCVWTFGLLAGCSGDSYRGWSEIVSAEHKFKVKMPAPPLDSRKKSPDGRQVAVWTVGDEIGRGGGGFNINAGPAFVPEGTGLERMRDDFLQATKARVVKESDFARDGKTIGRRLDVELPELRLKGVLVIVLGNGIDYQLTVMGTPNWEGWKKADRFFDSFELVEGVR